MLLNWSCIIHLRHHIKVLCASCLWPLFISMCKFAEAVICSNFEKKLISKLRKNLMTFSKLLIGICGGVYLFHT